MPMLHSAYILVYLSKPLCPHRNSYDAVVDLSGLVCYNGVTNGQGLVLLRPIDFVRLEHYIPCYMSTGPEFCLFLLH